MFLAFHWEGGRPKDGGPICCSSIWAGTCHPFHETSGLPKGHWKWKLWFLHNWLVPGSVCSPHLSPVSTGPASLIPAQILWLIQCGKNDNNNNSNNSWYFLTLWTFSFSPQFYKGGILLFPFSGEETEIQPNRVNSSLKVTKGEKRCEHSSEYHYKALEMKNYAMSLEILLSLKSTLPIPADSSLLVCLWFPLQTHLLSAERAHPMQLANLWRGSPGQRHTVEKGQSLQQ